jgi:hypothetical protein
MLGRPSLPLVSSIVVGLLLAARTARAEESPASTSLDTAAKKSASKFIRLEHNVDDEPTAMQTAIVSFAKPGEQEGATVDLIGAVHVGEKSYYDSLNEAFAKYDVVLYELVAPSGTRVPKGHKASNAHMAGAVQNGMKGVLALEHQLEMIDYTKENMVHADMSSNDVSKSMADRGENFLGMMFKFMGQGIAQQSRMQAKGKSFDTNFFSALFDKNRAIVLKRLMAEQFEDLETSMSAFNGKDGSTIITERNKVALKKLNEELQAGKKHIAIFYGAGHMPHMEERLVADFGLQRTGERWLTAWNLAESAAAKK